jgi:D-glycero-D-manno-heptose 1,7-bisphosphate phosphatase
MTSDAMAAGGRIAAIFACTHAPGEGCACRKPAPGLILAAVAASNVDPADTLVVGDDLRDVQAARAAHVPAALVLTGKGRAAFQRLPDRGTEVYDDLRALVDEILIGRHRGEVTNHDG